MIAIIIIFIYCCGAIFFGAILERVAKKQSLRTTEKIKASFWSGFWFSSAVFVPLTFFISSVIH